MAMRGNNPFDRALEARAGIPEDVRESAVWVTDTLDLCWDSARAVFEERAEPSLALAIFDRVVDRMREIALEKSAGAGALGGHDV